MMHWDQERTPLQLRWAQAEGFAITCSRDTASAWGLSAFNSRAVTGHLLDLISSVI